MRKFIADRKGAFAMQFALLVVPMTVCTGLAIDGGRAFLARYELASALDAAALAVGSTTIHEDSDLNAVAHSFVNANFHTPHNGTIQLELDADMDGEEDIVLLRGTVTIDTYFMPLIGQPTVTVSAESQVRRGGANIEVALALDVTGSMEEDGGGETRIEGLKSAANLFIDKVVNPIQTPFFSKVAIIPWSQSIHVDDTHVDAGALEDLRGTPVGSTGITSAGWRSPATTTKTITEAGWRKNAGGESVSEVTWRSGTRKGISGITKAAEAVVSATSHGFADGDFIAIYGVSGMTQVNGNIYKVSNVTTDTFKIKNPATDAFINSSGYSTYSGSSGDYAQKCFNAGCEIRVTTSSHDYASGDVIYLSGVGNPYGGVNNDADTPPWTVSNLIAPTTTVFFLAGSNGPAITTSTNVADEGTASECYVADCRYRVTTAGSHNFLTTDNVFIWGLVQSGSVTSANSAVNTTWKVQDPSATMFFLPGEGRSYRDWTSGGSAAECVLESCNVAITLDDDEYELQVNEGVQITGLAGLNTCTINEADGRCSSGSRMVWAVSAVSGDVATLADTTPLLSSTSGEYASGGTLQCTRYGCNRLWFKNSSNSDRLYKPTSCIVERYGADAYTDADPSDSPLGINYTANGSCSDDNFVTPLTSNRTRLTDAIAALDTGGSTAGQIGVAWGWYMLSENFDSIWDKEAENQPRPNDEDDLVKVLVLMTDGEFNYATCNGVTSSSISTSICVPDDADDATPSKHAAFKQAEAMCEAMKEQEIIIYTLGLQLNTALYSDDFLRECATSPAHAFLANNNAELETEFKKIAKEISKLRIAR